VAPDSYGGSCGGSSCGGSSCGGSSCGGSLYLHPIPLPEEVLRVLLGGHNVRVSVQLPRLQQHAAVCGPTARRAVALQLPRRWLQEALLHLPSTGPRVHGGVSLHGVRELRADQLRHLVVLGPPVLAALERTLAKGFIVDGLISGDFAPLEIEFHPPVLEVGRRALGTGMWIDESR